MPLRNPDIARLKAGYLFPEIARRRREFAAAHPDARLISLGVGNTTEPLLPHICAALKDGAAKLGKAETYSGYMDEGLLELRQRLCDGYYPGRFGPDEVFISDGSKCDIGRLQVLFGRDVKVCVQDPSYPVYVDGSVICGAAGGWAGEGYGGIRYLPCVEENDYFPDLSSIEEGSLVYFCSPNNPTGAAATLEQLTELVERARRTRSIIIYDAAYCEYIRGAGLPKTIYAVPGAEEAAIEVNSFSKSAGFTGVRLGWTVVPKALRYADGGSVHADWARLMATVFNGASNIAQAGGLAALDPEGLAEIRALTGFYLDNAALIRRALETRGIPCARSGNAPYIWASFGAEDSWAVFARLLERCHLITTPGSGFGPAGAGRVRLSAFASRASVEEACRRLSRL